MATEKKFIQISPLFTNRGVVLYALDSAGRVWELVHGHDRWTRLPFLRQQESEDSARARWTSTTRRPLDWLDSSQP